MCYLLPLFLDFSLLYHGQTGSKTALCFFRPPNVDSVIISRVTQVGRRKEIKDGFIKRTLFLEEPAASKPR